MLARVIVPLTAIGLQVGTGGAATAQYYIQRGTKGYALGSYEGGFRIEAANTVSKATEDLARIRTVLKSTVTELANALGVSRQSIYDWQSGQPITAENAAKLADMARATDIFATEGLTTTSQMLRRPISGGKNFFDMVRDGGSAEAAANMLVQLVRRENEQRKALDARLMKRNRRPVSSEDFGVPILNEEG